MTPSRDSHVPLALVLVSLFSLALLSMAVERQVARSFTYISEIAEPARTLVSRAQVDLALEAAATRAFLLTRDATFSERHREARADRNAALSQLAAAARALGGRITMESEVGRGSTFSLWLPLRSAASAA